MSTQDLVAKLWNFCNLLRGDGVTSTNTSTSLPFSDV